MTRTEPDLTFELEHYVKALTSASNRSRYVLILVTVVSLLVVLAHRNAAPYAWYQTREELCLLALNYRLWEGDLEKARNSFEIDHRQLRPDEFRSRWKKVEIAMRWVQGRRLLSEDDLKVWIRNLREAEARDIIHVTIPILGLRFDINDLGAIGGIGLMILMVILTYSMSREHETLVLCLWKVSYLNRRDRSWNHNGSLANFLYHALAMAQVFSRPPTLARWSGRRSRHLLFLIYLLPSIPLLLILMGDLENVEVAIALNPGQTKGIVAIEIVSIVVVSILGAFSAFFARSMDVRWRDAYFEINPRQSSEEPPPMFRWLRFKERSRQAGQ